MAKTNVNTGSSANDGTGDPLRTAFTSVNSNTDEIYTLFGNGTNLAISGDATVSSGALTIANDAVTTDKILNDAVTADKLANSINTEISANTAKVTNATHTGDVTGSTSLTIASSAVTTAKIAGNAVDYSKLANVFIAKTAITTLTGTVSYDCSVSSLFQLSGDITGAYTISLTGYNKGQVITIFPIKGNQTLNLAGAGSSTNTFNKIGGDYDDDGSASNVLQIECVDDSATDPIFFYSIATFTADSSDI
tara:strand:+ start:20 stop:769 length:750 start_codon:yes stop_codon:yes gene_type:complete